MYRLQTVCVAMASICLWSSLAWADLSIIYDSGATRPLVPFLGCFRSGAALGGGPALIGAHARAWRR